VDLSSYFPWTQLQRGNYFSQLTVGTWSPGGTEPRRPDSLLELPEKCDSSARCGGKGGKKSMSLIGSDYKSQI